jgi:hypothetical protein
MGTRSVYYKSKMCTTRIERVSRYHPSIHLFLKNGGWIGPRADKGKKKEARRAFAIPSITIMCTYDFGSVGALSQPHSQYSKKERRGPFFFEFIEAKIGLGFRVSCHLVNVIRTFRV